MGDRGKLSGYTGKVMNKDIFDRLFDVIYDRKMTPSEKSYVASLMQKGTDKINSKILEEAEEVCEAALEDGKEHLTYEICDLLFHTFVLASYRGVGLDEIRGELERRFGTGGLEEKAGRKDK